MTKIIKNKRKTTNKKLKSMHLKGNGEKVTDIEMADDFLSRLMGLMFRENAKIPLLFEIPQTIGRKERSSMHSLFMRFDIILVFIDENNIVYEIADLSPWNYHIPKKSAKYVVEFDKGNFNDCLRIGDEIEIR